MTSTMTRPKLYLFVGYPGAGKTTASKIIAQHTGATHLWADHVRGKMFERPLHSVDESHQLYERLNQRTAELLAAGQSVIYDTTGDGPPKSNQSARSTPVRAFSAP